MSEYEDFKSYLELQNARVKSNISEVSAEKLGQSFMLHIDNETPDAFTPRIGKSFSDDEDNTMPRITVSDTLLGCIIGYYRFISDFLEAKEPKSNGYYINMIPFDYCVKPTAKLVPYAEAANEYWLIGYSKQTLKYKPTTIGKIFVHSMEHILNDKQGQHDIRCTFFVEITEDVAIRFSKDKELKQGYYKVVGDLSDYNSNNDNDGSDSIHHKDLKLFNIRKISEDEYKSRKKLSATMLDATSVSIPVYSKW